MLYNNAQYKNESMDQGSVVEYYKKLKDIISTNDGEHEEFQTKDLCKYLNTLCYQFCYTRETFITSNVPVTIFTVKNKNVLEVWVPLASHVGVLFSSKKGHSGNNRLFDHTQSTEELNRRMY